MKVRLEFKLEDMWRGAYWRKKDGILHVWICIYPCFPIHIEVPWHE